MKYLRRPLRYRAKQKLSGLIYMHRISDPRLTGISRRNFSMFRKLCGEETLKNVVIVSTMWDETPHARAESREKELKTDPELDFKAALDKGASMKRHDNTKESAHAILQHFLQNQPRTLRIQKELVDKKWDIVETSAGMELNDHLARLAADHKKRLGDLEREMKRALTEKDEETRQRLKRDRRALETKLRKANEEREQMSRVHEQMQLKANERLKEIQEELEKEKQTRQEGQKKMERLERDLERAQSKSKAEREKMQEELDKLRRRYRKRRREGVFVKIGRAIDSLFVSTD